MDIYNFINKTDYPEFKKIMLQEFLTKPLDIKSTTTAGIALEVKASQLAIEKLVKAFKSFEAMAVAKTVETKPFR